jgi:hypothetical protein
MRLGMAMSGVCCRSAIPLGTEHADQIARRDLLEEANAYMFQKMLSVLPEIEVRLECHPKGFQRNTSATDFDKVLYVFRVCGLKLAGSRGDNDIEPSCRL